MITGGLLAVMYMDALQGRLMFIGMAILLALSCIKLGGITEAHMALTNMSSLIPDSLGLSRL